MPDVANHVPHVRVTWDQAALGLTPQECASKLEQGDPSIVCLVDEKEKGLGFTAYMMQPGDELTVARRLRAVLVEAGKKQSQG